MSELLDLKNMYRQPGVPEGHHGGHTGHVTVTHSGHVSVTHPGHVSVSHPGHVSVAPPGHVSVSHPGHTPQQQQQDRMLQIYQKTLQPTSMPRMDLGVQSVENMGAVVCGGAGNNRPPQFVQPSIVRHKHVLAEEDPYVCEVCGKHFLELTPSLLSAATGQATLPPQNQQHILPVSSTNTFYASEPCPKVFSSVSSNTQSLQKHIRPPHFDLNVYPAEVFNKQFIPVSSAAPIAMSPSVVETQLRAPPAPPPPPPSQPIVAGSGERPYACEQCGKKFRKSSNLICHRRTHTGDKPYNCNICNKNFTQSSSLKVHMRVHTGQKPYPCVTCGKQFSVSSDLQKHVRIHTGERPYICGDCGKTFSQSCSLRVHQRIHTKEQPFECTVCNKRFSVLGNLQIHKRVHTGDKPFSCTECGKKFAVSSNLKKHLRVHTGERPYKCSKCPRCFIASSDLHRHMRKQHKDRPKAEETEEEMLKSQQESKTVAEVEGHSESVDENEETSQGSNASPSSIIYHMMKEEKLLAGMEDGSGAHEHPSGNVEDKLPAAS